MLHHGPTIANNVLSKANMCADGTIDDAVWKQRQETGRAVFVLGEEKVETVVGRLQTTFDLNEERTSRIGMMRQTN